MAEEMSLTQKIISVQSELKAPKNLWNKFSSFYYRNAESILEAAKPLNAQYGLLLTITDEPLLIGEWHYIKAIATVTDGKETLVVSAYAREPGEKKGMDSAQVTGATSSYARKYALNGLYMIDDTKDPDTDEYQNQSKNSNQNNQAPKKASQKQMGLLFSKTKELAQAHNMDVQKVKEQLSISENMDEQQFKATLKRVENGINKAKENGPHPDANSEDIGMA